jgi:hypothetical protein
MRAATGKFHHLERGRTDRHVRDGIKGLIVPAKTCPPLKIPCPKLEDALRKARLLPKGCQLPQGKKITIKVVPTKPN